MLFRGGLRDADVLLAEFDAVGDGVEDILISGSSSFMSDMLSFEGVDIVSVAPICQVYSSTKPGCRLLLCDKLTSMLTVE